MKKTVLPLPRIMVALVASLAAMGISAAEPERARLLVGIVVDGLESDYLELLRDRFGDGGFRRLEREGVTIANADYGMPMDAAAASAILATGASPSLSGIAASEHYDREALRPVSVYADAAVLGNFTSTPYSPAALRLSTLSDEARIADGGTNLVYAVGMDPAQVLALGGHAANASIWLDDKTGNWASSTYFSELPNTVSMRNRTRPLSLRMDTMSWTPSLAPAEFPALPDYLRSYPFRYVFPKANPKRLDMFKASPLANREVNELALELISSLKMGEHEGVTDVINIAYSLEPYTFGKNPDTRMELMDSYIKLDRNLEQLFNTIDGSVGLGNTVVYLAATPPTGRSKRDDERWNIPYGEFSTRRAVSLLNVYLIARYGNGDYISAYHNRQFFLNRELLSSLNLDVEAVSADAAAFLARMTGVDRAYTLTQIVAGQAGEHSEILRRNTFIPHAGDITVEVAPGFEIIDDYNAAASADSPRVVERAVAATAPVFVMAPGLVPAVIGSPVDARIVAPTVARILRIRSPNGAALAPLTLQRK